MAIHNIVHVEISAKERKAFSKFYGDVFGWEIKHLDEMGYTTFETGEGVGGGFNPVTDQILPVLLPSTSRRTMLPRHLMMY